MTNQFCRKSDFDSAIQIVLNTVAKSIGNWNEPSSFILDSFSNFSATKKNLKKTPKIFVDAEVFFLKWNWLNI